MTKKPDSFSCPSGSSDRCYYLTGFDGERVLIPECWRAVDVGYCVCREEEEFDIGQYDLQMQIHELQVRLENLKKLKDYNSDVTKITSRDDFPLDE